jgi:hypothetical protein
MAWKDPSKMPIQEVEETRTVDVPLGDTEQLLLGKQLEAKLAEIDEEEANEKVRRDIHRDRVGGLWDEVREFRRQILKSVRQELRKVKVFANWNAGRIKVSDAATGAVYEERAMTPEERQGALF